MRLDTACAPAFARHETFHPRYGWIKKSVDASTEDPDVFSRDEAVVILGVGKNMVRSIRHWGVAFKVLESWKVPGSRVAMASPSRFGEILFGERGWDPYCEQIGTLWLLHWLLLAPRSSVPVWWLAFSEFAAVEFTDDELEQFVADRTKGWADPHESSIKKDVSCLLRMYARNPDRTSFEDMIDSPFRELDLIRPSVMTPGAWRFIIGEKPTLPPAVAAFAALDFVARIESSARTVTVSRLATEAGSPGRAFKLSEQALLSLLERATTTCTEIEIAQVAGVHQLAFAGDPSEVATELLWDHYRSIPGNSQARFPGHHLIAGPSAGDAIQRVLTDSEVLR